MDVIDYSVVIRTTGKAGPKYAKLLESIEGLIPRPREVIVVLPEGYSLPPERLGWETFYFCPKGMVAQRLFGIVQCKTPYALITDDDIAFSSDFVQKLYQPVADGSFGLSAGPLLEFFPRKGIKAFFWALGAAAVPTVWHKNHYTTVLHSSGYSYNRNVDLSRKEPYEAQTAAWTCFFADVEKLRSIHFEDEVWLDRLGYSAHDDTAMFYKAWLRGIKTGIVPLAVYQHLDGKTSTKGRSVAVEKATGFTRFVFWYRFIFQQSTGIEKIWSIVCIGYRMIFQIMCDFIRCCAGKRSFDEVSAYISGIIEGLRWVKKGKFKELPPVV